MWASLGSRLATSSMARPNRDEKAPTSIAPPASTSRWLRGRPRPVRWHQRPDPVGHLPPLSRRCRTTSQTTPVWTQQELSHSSPTHPRQPDVETTTLHLLKVMRSTCWVVPAPAARSAPTNPRPGHERAIPPPKRPIGRRAEATCELRPGVSAPNLAPRRQPFPTSSTQAPTAWY